MLDRVATEGLSGRSLGRGEMLGPPRTHLRSRRLTPQVRSTNPHACPRALWARSNATGLALVFGASDL